MSNPSMHIPHISDAKLFFPTESIVDLVYLNVPFGFPSLSV